jgi:hypothetical protein
MRWLVVSCIPPFNSTSLIWPLLISGLALVALFFPKTEGWAQSVELGTSSAEFSARLVWKNDGRKAKAQLFVKNDRYRIEHFGGVKTELGYAGVTIVRLDEQKVWYVLSERRMVVSVPLTSEYLLPFSVRLEGETSRTLIGDSMVNNQFAVLYDVEVQDRFGKTERFFEWVDPDKNVLLKLVSQDRDWFVEYEHVVVSTQPEFYFETPLGYRIIEAQQAQSPKG